MSATTTGAPDNGYRMSRRRFVDLSIKAALLAGGIGLSGCLGGGDGDGDKKNPGTQLGEYTITTSHQIVSESQSPAYAKTDYGKISDPQKALEESQAYLKSLVNEPYRDAKAAALSLVSALPYNVKYIKSDSKATVTPTPTGTPVSTTNPSDELADISRYVFNVNDSVLGNINKYLATGDKESEKYIRQFFGDKGGLDVVDLWRRQGVEIKSYGIPVAIKTEDETLMFVESTFYTKPDEPKISVTNNSVIGDIRIMYRNISSDKEKPIWKPEKITHSKIHAPTGDDLYYVGNAKGHHGWIDIREGTDITNGFIPLIPQAVYESLNNPGMHVSEFAKKYFGYDSIKDVPLGEDREGRPIRVITGNYEGGKIIVTGGGEAEVESFKKGLYNIEFSSDDEIGKDLITDIRARRFEGGDSTRLIEYIKDNTERLGLMWAAGIKADLGNVISDGFIQLGENGPADGVADEMKMG